MWKDSQAYNSKSIAPACTNTNIGNGKLTQASNEVERITENVFKDDFGRFSNQFSENHKAEVFVEKSTGRTGFKEEIKYKSTRNFDDKLRGCSRQSQIEVKFKEVTFPSQNGSKATALPKSSYGYDNSTTSKYYGTADAGAYDDESDYEEFYDHSDEMRTVDNDDDHESYYGEEADAAYMDGGCDEDVDHGYSEDDYVDYDYSDE